MTISKAKKITICLVVLWLTLGVIAYAFGFYDYIRAGLHQQERNPVLGMCLIASVVVIFFPLMLLIRKYSALAQMPKLHKAAKIITVLYIPFLVVAPLATLLALI